MNHVRNLFLRFPSLADCQPDLELALLLLQNCYKNGGKVLTCGNGGSASDSLHIAGELMKDFKIKRQFRQKEINLFKLAKNGNYLLNSISPGLPTISLNSEVALMTAIINDQDSSCIFAQQVWSLGDSKDVLWALSTSGNSKNIVLAAETAKIKGMKVLAMTGANDSLLSAIADVTIKAPSSETPIIQEYHLPIYHTLCLSLEDYFFG